MIASALLEQVERMAAAADAPAVDAAAERAKAARILDGLADLGVVSAPSPEAQGGLGLPIIEIARLIAAVSRVSGSAGLICAMHLSQLFTLVRHGRTPRFDDFLRRQARDRILIASGTSEAEVGGDILRSLCRTERDGGRLRLLKRCTNVSYLDRARAMLATAMHDAEGRPIQRLILLETPDLSFSVETETLLMGMRGAAHQSVVIEAAFDSSAIFPEPFQVIARTMSASSHVLWSAVWSGLATAALEKAAPAGVEGDAAFRLERARERLYVLNALVRDAAAAFDGEDAGRSPFLQGARFNGLKIHAAELLGGIVADCALAAGFRGYVEGTPSSLSEIVRDSFSAGIMVSNDRLAAANAKVRRFAGERI